MDKRKKQISGFTLVEMLIVLAVLVMILAVITVSINQVTTKNQINIGLNNFSTQLKLIQNYSITGKQIPNENFVPEYGYGLHYDYPESRTFVFFADRYMQGQTYAFDENSCATDCDQVLFEYSLPENVVFSNCIYDGSPVVTASTPPGVYSCDIVSEIYSDNISVKDDHGGQIPSSQDFFEFVITDNNTGEIKSIRVKKWLALIYQDDE